MFKQASRIFDTIYQCESENTKKLLSKVDQTFCDDVVDVVYGTIWQTNVSISINERALIAVTSLYEQNKILALKTLLKAYYFTCESVNSMPELVSRATEAAISDDPAIKESLQKILIDRGLAMQPGEAISVRDCTIREKQHDITNLVKMLIDKPLTENIEAIKIIFNKYDINITASIILQMLPYCGLRCLIPSFEILSEISPDFMIIIMNKLTVVNAIILDKHSDDTLTTEERILIAKQTMGEDLFEKLKVYLPGLYPDGVPKHEEEALIMLTADLNNNNNESIVTSEIAIDKKRAILNYIWIYQGCPTTWEAHNIINMQNEEKKDHE